MRDCGRFFRVALCGFAGVLFASGCSRPAVVDAKAAEQAVRDMDAQWSKAAAAHDLAGVLSYYADDAIVLPPNERTITNKQTNHDEWAALLTPGMDLSWKADRVEAAGSGDMAYETGTYTLNMKDAKGNSTTDKGKVLQVWKKQGDGSWKAVADMWSSDLAAVASEGAVAKK
jgi:ketosteroid isomerase-like protein